MNLNIKLAGLNAVVHLPVSYAVSTQTYPVIYFFPGTGEVGTDITKLLIYGPNAYIAAGWNGIINNHEYIIISIQPSGLYPRPWVIKAAIDAAEIAYRVDKTKVCMTGLSMGGWVSNIFATYKPTATDFSYLDRVKCVLNVQGVVPDDNYDATPVYPNKFTEWANRGGKELCLEQILDNRSMDKITNTMNAAVAGSSVYVQTAFGNGGHCCWQQVYGGSWQKDNKTAYEIVDNYLYDNTTVIINPPPPPPPPVPVVATAVITLYSDGTWKKII